MYDKLVDAALDQKNLAGYVKARSYYHHGLKYLVSSGKAKKSYRLSNPKRVRPVVYDHEDIARGD